MLRPNDLFGLIWRAYTFILIFTVFLSFSTENSDSGFYQKYYAFLFLLSFLAAAPLLSEFLTYLYRNSTEVFLFSSLLDRRADCGAGGGNRLCLRSPTPPPDGKPHPGGYLCEYRRAAIPIFHFLCDRRSYLPSWRSLYVFSGPLHARHLGGRVRTVYWLPVRTG